MAGTVSAPRAESRPSVVATRDLGAGANALVWGGWLGAPPAPAGSYALTVEARGCGKTRRRSTTIAIA
jgi:hypothetical protein